MHIPRIGQVIEKLRAHGLNQLLICDPVSILYLTGYYTEPHERLLALHLEERDGTVSSTLFCNALFPDAEGAADQIVTYTDTDDPLALVASVLDPTAPLGVNKDLPARWLVPLIDARAAKKFVLGSFAVDDTRSCKDAEERALMREASRINDTAMSWLAEQVKVGISEQEIAQGLLGAYRDLGADEFSFAPIVSFGANAADPHHEPDGTTLNAGDMVLFDVGCRKDGYCSDMTRTFFTAAPTPHQLEIYSLVRRANEAAEAIVKPGVRFSEIDRTARSIIEEAGYGPYFNHRLGHQIGLLVHEPGDVSASHHEEVRPGQVFSIEPGIYLEDDIGVRIEDLVMVTEDGCEVLNHYSHEPQVLPI